jgi:predicted transposase YbfD/YdcC
MKAGKLRSALVTHFATLEDPRVERTRAHELLDLVAIAICAVLCGADGWVDVATFAQAKEDWLRTFLALPGGIPSHDTFGRVFARLDPQQFAACFASWVGAVAQRLGLKQVAIDGKTARRSHDRGRGKAALHLVSAWATECHVSLGQVPVAEGSNEIPAIPKLLELLDVEGALVTIDALGCQKEIAATIRARGADYLLAVKENQERLYEDLEALHAEALANDWAGVDSAWEEGRGHGREELRACWVYRDVRKVRDRDLWPDLRSLVIVVRDRTEGAKNSCAVHYYISSRRSSAQKFLQAVRSHWGIENSLHWVLDVTFEEDGSRVRKDHGPANLALLRRLAVSMLQQADGGKGSLRGKRLQAGWRNDFLEQVIAGFKGN